MADIWVVLVEKEMGFEGRRWRFRERVEMESFEERDLGESLVVVVEKEIAAGERNLEIVKEAGIVNGSGKKGRESEVFVGFGFGLGGAGNKGSHVRRRRGCDDRLFIFGVFCWEVGFG